MHFRVDHPDVFISYSRKDTEFVRQLFDTLGQDGRAAWVDWRGIDYSTQWWQEICDGIEKSDNFVLIITPNSLTSRYCHQEIEHARQHNKRIVTILRTPVQDDQGNLLPDILAAWFDRDWETLARANWQYLTTIQYLSFQEHDDFIEAFRAFRATIDKDPQHIKMHTRLLLWAREWQKSERNPSLLLKGDDLKQFEVWKDNIGDEIPRPSPLQDAYIAESRRVEDEDLRQEALKRKRTRQLGTASVILAVVTLATIIAGSLAFVSAQDARDQSRAAQTSEAQALAVGARVEAQSTSFALEQSWAATLATGGVILPPDRPTQAPADFRATLTQVATLSQWSPVIEPDEFGVEMVLVPAGCYWMGSLVEQVEQPIREICFDQPFWIDRFEVTNAQFDRLGGVALAASSWPNPNQPRTDITWFEARRFCEEVRRTYLPTEAQWEYAARGPTDQVYPWVGPFDEANAIYYYNAGQARDVGEDIRSGGRSWVGAYDLSGNVWEWTSSLYKPYPYDAADGREDPANSRDFRIYRGGSFKHNDYDLRAAKRGWNQPGHAEDGLGFRCARPN